MGNEEVDLVTVVKPEEKRSLLNKYDIPVEHLSYEHIARCSKFRELERIILVLRSGEEGIFPDLINHAEKCLAKLKPRSKVLRVEQPVITSSQLGPDDRRIIDDEFTEWMNEMQGREKDLEEGKALADSTGAIPQPEIRQTPKANLKKSLEPKIGMKLKNEKSIASCDYEGWDKFDADAELDRMDLNDERKQVEAKDLQQKNREKYEEAKKFSRETMVNKLTLTATELSVMAEQEKNIGNEAYRAGDYEEALIRYSSSVKINPNVNGFNNRAITNIKLERYQDAVNDCNAVLSMEYNNVTALMRRGLASEKLEKVSEALVDYQSILQIEPNNKIAIAGVNKLRKPSDSKKVRMKIEEESDDKVVQVGPEINKIVKRVEISEIITDHGESSGDRIKNLSDFYKNGISEICFCDRAPGSSQYRKPPPHCKSSYCLSPESEVMTNRREEKCIIGRSKSQHSYFSDVKTINVGLNSDTDSSKLIIEELAVSDDDYLPIASIPKPDSEPAESLKREEFRAGGGGDNNFVHGNENYMQEVPKNGAKNSEQEEIDSEFKSKLKITADDKRIGTVVDKMSKKEFHTGFKSPYEFLHVWESLKNDADLSHHANLLRSLSSPGDLEAVIGNKLDGSMLTVILQSLERHFFKRGDTALIHRLITSLSKIPRFSIIRLFMDSSDKRVLKNILQFLENEGVSSADISLLQDAYDL